MRGWAVLCGLMVGLWTTVAFAGPPKPKNAKARRHFDRAVELYTEGEFDASAQEARAGHEIESHESLLFIWAQAERKRGNCGDAVALFDDFIEATENDAMRDNALTAKGICAEELAEEARLAEEAAGAAIAEEEEEAEPEFEAIPTPHPAEPDPRPWYRDPLGGVLVGVGGAGVLTGGGLLIASLVLDPKRASDYGSFAQRQRVQPKLVLGGAVAAGAGAAIAIAGGVRWLLVARKAKRAGTGQAGLQIAPWTSGWTSGARAGATFSLRF